MSRSLGRQFEAYVEPDTGTEKVPSKRTRSGLDQRRARSNMANWRLERQRHVQGGIPRNRRHESYDSFTGGGARS